MGAGVMGTGIAQIAVCAGDEVVLYDQNSEAIAHARTRIAEQLQKLVEKSILTKEAREAALGRLKAGHQLDDAQDCEVAIDAVKEDKEIKKSLFQALEAVVSPATRILSNTSTLSITDLSLALREKHRFGGMHFFNPVPRMPLVEVIKGKETSDDTVQFTCALAVDWGKKPVLAPDSPGFIVNRIFDAIKREALSLHAEGVAISEIDEAVRLGLGFPMGPFELMDLIGLDTTYACLVNQAQQMNRPPAFGKRLPQLVASGNLGRKTGAGFYTYPRKNIPSQNLSAG